MYISSLKEGHLNFILSFNGWGLTLIDSLDTMWIMGLHDEFYDSLPLVANMTFASSSVRLLISRSLYSSLLIDYSPEICTIF